MLNNNDFDTKPSDVLGDIDPCYFDILEKKDLLERIDYLDKAILEWKKIAITHQEVADTWKKMFFEDRENL